MDGPARAFVLALAVIALAAVHAHVPSRDNILRIQLWDAEGLSREPVTTPTPTTTGSPIAPGAPTTRVERPKKLRVDENSLYDAMLQEAHPGGFGRFTRHKVRHKRRGRRIRRAGTELPWRFHAGDQPFNVAVYEDDVPWTELEGAPVNASAVSDSAVAERPVAPPMTQRQPRDEEDEVKELPVVPKCCPSGQNLTITFENGEVKKACAQTTLTFAPVFHQANETHIFSYDSNVYETIVGNPCSYERYILEPEKSSIDEYYLLVNGSLFVPYGKPFLLSTKDYCMETFYNESNAAGITLPMVCFQTPFEETKTSATLIAYATGLLISVPFLLATACVYLLITELRDTHGKALACHTICLAVAFTCLAATQLAGHAFPSVACTIMAYLIQFSFVSCFFWLNVMSFDIFLNVRRYINASVTRRSMRRRFAWYSAYAILLPMVLLIITITMELAPAVPSTYLKPNFGVKGCWFKTDQAALPYFYGPVALILFSNLIIFFLTSRAFTIHYEKLKSVTHLYMTHSDFNGDDQSGLRQTQSSDTSDAWVNLSHVLGQPLTVPDQTESPRETNGNFNQRLTKYRKIFRTSCMLSIIMGLTWVLEVVSWAAGAGTSAVSVWSVFDLINALQGVVIFAIFVLQQPVRTFVRNSRIFQSCGSKRDGSEVTVVSERNSMIGPGRRDYV